MFTILISLCSAQANEPLFGTVMQPWGQLQVFATVYDQDASVQADPASYGDPEADPGFQLARARFGFDGELPLRQDGPTVVDYSLSLGISTPYDALTLGTSSVTMVTGFARVTNAHGIGQGRLAVGLVKVPFSRESMISSKNLVFMERGVGPANLAPVRDVGALAREQLAFGDASDAPTIALQVGVFNGNANVLGDQDPGLLYGGRLEFFKGDTYKTWSPDGGVAGGAAISAQLNDELATSTFAWNADGLLRVGPWSLQGEFGQATLTPTDSTVGQPDVLATTTKISWLAGTSVFLKTHADSGIEVSVRASSFDDNTRIQDNGDVLIVHGGATWRSLLPMFDVGAGYIHREELGGSTIPNDTIRLWTQVRPSFRKK